MAPSEPGSVFWDDLNEDLKDIRFRRMYVRESWRVRMVDRLINGVIAVRTLRRRSSAGRAPNS